MENLVRKNILNLSPYLSAREEYSEKKGVFLDANENPFGIYNRYPDPYQETLKQRLSEIKNILSNRIFIGNGSDEIIDIAFRIFCEPYRDKALTFIPTYGMYEVSANINAVELIKIPLNSDFQIDKKTIEPFFSDKNLKLIFICSPNNPTGNLLKSEDIEFILQNFKGIVIVDEAYIDFCDQPSFLEKIEKYPNLIVSQTLSKAWGLAGIRLGIAYMNESFLSYYNKVKAPYNISAVNQKIALETLHNIEEYEQKRNEILSEKTKLINELKGLKIVRKIYPSDANFLLIEADNANELYSQLIAKQIIIRNRNTVIPNCLRITVGTQEENQKLVIALKQISNG
ncbi:histidinol-phosphate aminotransferase [Paenimyroides aquimaris]|uniref:Histidinol-phosphate aminotransferase n=1 Tax=Paenimyroides marinum TaxID=1159016 RepID=A0A1H6K136_9FLAO|nr:histidinol-phosphate transaminase [Paenimyroides aquimaris]SEH65282.1 histidinol-phosphate aminotransferase [Paenimyroides aquimaris]